MNQRVDSIVADINQPLQQKEKITGERILRYNELIESFEEMTIMLKDEWINS